MLTLILIALALGIAVLVVLVRGTAPKLDLPGPKQHWLLGNAKDLTKSLYNRHLWWREISRTYGNVVYYRAFGSNIVHISDPELLESVFKNYDVFPHRPVERNAFKKIVPLGLLAMDTGDMWNRHRRLLSPLFAEKFMSLYSKVIMEHGEKLFNMWAGLKRGEKVEIQNAFIRMTLDVIGESGFGHDFDTLGNPNSPFVAAGQDILEEIVRKAIVPKVIAALDLKRRNKLANGAAPFYKVVDSILKASEANPAAAENSKSMLSELIRMKDDEGKLTYEEVRDEIITLMLAGHETTANTMSWSIYLLARNPSVQAKMRQEIESVLHGRAPTYEDRKDLKYSEWVVKETLRFYPTVPVVPREAMEDVRVGNYSFPKGTIIGADLVSMHIDPKIWGDADVFRPERFDEDDPANNRHPFAFMPFGGGRRICIGQRFAYLEAMLILSRAVQLFEFRIDPNQAVEEFTDITLGPKSGLLVEVIPVKSRSQE